MFCGLPEIGTGRSMHLQGMNLASARGARTAPEARTVTITTSLTRTSARVLPLAAMVAFNLPMALAADWPAFTPGQWTFDRTMTGPGPVPQKVSTTKCIDPTADQKAQQATLTKAGCQFTPIVQNGKTYRYSATCKMAGMTTTSTSVLEVESAEAYTLTVDSTVDGEKAHEVLRARRTGDCPR